MQKTPVGSISGGIGVDVSSLELEGPPIKFLLGLPAIGVRFYLQGCCVLVYYLFKGGFVF